jgi:hypothetical protein
VSLVVMARAVWTAMVASWAAGTVVWVLGPQRGRRGQQCRWPWQRCGRARPQSRRPNPQHGLTGKVGTPERRTGMAAGRVGATWGRQGQSLKNGSGARTLLQMIKTENKSRLNFISMYTVRGQQSMGSLYTTTIYCVQDIAGQCIGIEADAVGISIPASSISVLYWSIPVPDWLPLFWY